MTDISEVLTVFHPYGAERTGSPSTNKIVPFAFRHLRFVSKWEYISNFFDFHDKWAESCLKSEMTTNLSQDTEKSPYNRRVGSQTLAMKKNKKTSLLNLYQTICW